jgi:hypothetical protein
MVVPRTIGTKGRSPLPVLRRYRLERAATHPLIVVVASRRGSLYGKAS